MSENKNLGLVGNNLLKIGSVLSGNSSKGSSVDNAYDFLMSNNSPKDGIDIREFWLVLRRNYSAIFGVIGFFLFLATIFLIITPARYTSNAVLQVNVQKNNVIGIESVMSGVTSDEPQIQSQLDVMTSRTIAGNVVDALNLTKDLEFSPDISNGGVFKWISNLFNNENAADEDDKNKDNTVRLETINKVLKGLKVTRNPKSYTIIINFTSKDPEKSAKIANAFVDQYLQGQLSMKFDATKRANSWLTSKLSELQSKVRDSELAEQAFRQKNGLIETGGRTVSDQQLSELNSQLILARTEKAQAEAKLRGTGNKDSSSDVLKSVLIQNLRTQETEVLRKKSDLSSQYGPKHPKIINVNSELRDLRDKINIEIQKVNGSLESDVNVAAARVISLQKSLDELQDKSNLSTKARIELDELVRQKLANKALYESFLARSKETSEGQGMEKSDAFVISNAETPSNASFPSKSIVLLIALILGTLAGVMLALLIEHLDNAINSSKQAEEITSINSIGMIPELQKTPNIISYLLKRPSSIFAESLRSVLTAVHFSNPDKTPQVIMVTSSVPKEGKSSFSMSFSTLVANSGKKVLLIDADLKRPTVAKTLKREFKFSLSDLLTGTATAEQVICHEKESGLDFIPANPNTVNSHNLLGSNKMKELLEKMRTKYDMIIIDTPPVMAISDCIVLANFVDTTVFIVRWQKTPKEIVKAAAKQLKSFNINVAGLVLTRVDMDKQSKYGYGEKGHYYKSYSEYYSS